MVLAALYRRCLSAVNVKFLIERLEFTTALSRLFRLNLKIGVFRYSLDDNAARQYAGPFMLTANASPNTFRQESGVARRQPDCHQSM
jgi:hypothetical protein